MKKKIVIVGGCAAGPKCAAKSRRMDSESEIVLYTKGNIISYSACGLPYYVGGQVKDIHQLIVRTPEDFKKVGVDVYTNHTCTKINPNEKTIVVNDETISYDDLVLAVGANAVTPPIPNVQLKNIYHLTTLDEGAAIKELMQNSKSVLIIGAGYIAVELLEAFVSNGLFVTMLERSGQVLSNFDEEMSAVIEKDIFDDDTKAVVYKNDEVTEFLGEDGEFRGAKTKQGREIMADFCVLCTGVKPNTQLAQDAGIEIGITGAIKVDKRMRTSAPNIWAIGDCAEKFCMITGVPQYMALGSTANKEGRVCAINVNGGNEDFEGILGSAVTRCHSYTISITGMTDRSVRKHPEFDPVSVLITDADRAGYMPEMQEITLKLVGDRKTRRILGAQAVGKGDADKRINTVTAAIQSRMCVDEFANNDMTYAPPFSMAIDPLLAATAILKEKMDKK